MLAGMVHARRLYRQLLDDELTKPLGSVFKAYPFACKTPTSRALPLGPGTFQHFGATLRALKLFHEAAFSRLPWYPSNVPGSWDDEEAWEFSDYKGGRKYVYLNAQVATTNKETLLQPIAKAPCLGRLLAVTRVIHDYPHGFKYLDKPVIQLILSDEK